MTGASFSSPSPSLARMNPPYIVPPPSINLEGVSAMASYLVTRDVGKRGWICALICRRYIPGRCVIIAACELLYTAPIRSMQSMNSSSIQHQAKSSGAAD